jgi:hypothetical protein
MNILEEIPKSKSESILSSLPSKSTSYSKDITSSQSNFSSNEPLSDHFSVFDLRTLIIIFLLFLILLTYFGINVLKIFGEAMQKGVDLLSPAFTQLLDMIGYSSGSALNTAAELTSDVTKESVDIAEGAIKNVGNILIGDEAVGHQKYKNVLNEPSPDVPEDNIQKSLTASKTKWCLIGEYKNKRGCVDISESDKCLSGQVFPNEEMCLNPTLQSQN